MLLTDRAADLLVWIAMGVLLLGVVAGWILLRKRYRDRWWFSFPVSFPLAPLLLVGAILLPILSYNWGSRVIVVRPEGAGLARTDHRVFFSADCPLQNGGRIRIRAERERKIVVNDTPVPLRLLTIHYTLGGGPEESLDLPPGGSGAASGDMRLLQPGESPPPTIAAKSYVETITFILRRE